MQVDISRKGQHDHGLHVKKIEKIIGNTLLSSSTIPPRGRGTQLRIDAMHAATLPRVRAAKVPHPSANFSHYRTSDNIYNSLFPLPVSAPVLKVMATPCLVHSDSQSQQR